MPTSTDPAPETLAAALAILQTRLPKIGKDSPGMVRDGKRIMYANLTTVSEALLPLLGKLGLSFTCHPSITESGAFVLNYTLLHVSGDTVAGAYPLPTTGSPQQIGSAITYARRYCLCAVTGEAPDEDDDDAQAAAETRTAEPQARGPVVRRRGRITRTKGDTGPDQWSSVDSNGERQPGGELGATYPPGQRQLGALQAHFKRLGFEDHDRDERLAVTAIITGAPRDLASSKDLTQDQVKAALKVLEKCRDRPSLTAAVAELAESEDAGA